MPCHPPHDSFFTLPPDSSSSSPSLPPSFLLFSIPCPSLPFPSLRVFPIIRSHPCPPRFLPSLLLSFLHVSASLLYDVQLFFTTESCEVLHVLFLLSSFSLNLQCQPWLALKLRLCGSIGIACDSGGLISFSFF